MSNRDRARTIWQRPEPGARRPRHTREQIAAAALAIADREGFEAVSMRRVAAEVGAGTMTLYHYVRTKDDLVDLMDDAIMGEVLVPDGELPATWREAVGAIARRSHAAFIRHPWALGALSGSGGGPNGMRHFEQSLASVASLDIDMTAKLDLIALVDDYVFGFVFRTSQMEEAFSDTVGEETIAELLPHFEAQIRSGDYPHIAALFGDGLFGDGDTRETWELILATMTAPARFEQGLELLLDGIEAKLGRDGA
jgi:AcrR family transcriptional regulator